MVGSRARIVTLPSLYPWQVRSPSPHSTPPPAGELGSAALALHRPEIKPPASVRSIPIMPAHVRLRPRAPHLCCPLPGAGWRTRPDHPDFRARLRSEPPPSSIQSLGDPPHVYATRAVAMRAGLSRRRSGALRGQTAARAALSALRRAHCLRARPLPPQDQLPAYRGTPDRAAPPKQSLVTPQPVTRLNALRLYDIAKCHKPAIMAESSPERRASGRGFVLYDSARNCDATQYPPESTGWNGPLTL